MATLGKGSTMEAIETIERGENLRARIVPDTDAQMPYGDALAPVFRLGARTWQASDVVSDYEPTDLMPGDVADAMERFDSDHDKVERYLRMFHGVTAVEWITPPTSAETYIVFDTPDWRKHVGWGDARNYFKPEVREAVKATRDEWRAWTEGEVYGVIVERRDRGVTFWHSGGFDQTERWEESDATCWGFYGIDSAKEYAKSELDALTMTAPHRCDKCGTLYDEAKGDGYGGLCPSCADKGE